MAPAPQPAARRVPAARTTRSTTAGGRTTRAGAAGAAASTAAGSSSVAEGKQAVLDGKAGASSTGDEAASRGGAGVLGTRKRPALGDLTNAKASRANSANVAGPSGASGLEKRAATTSGTTLKEAGTSRVRAAPTAAAASTAAGSKVRTGTSTSTASRTAAAVRAGTAKREPIDDTRVTKRPRVDVAVAAHQAHLAAQQASVPVVHAQAKDEGWEDLDAEDADDPLMVAEYVNEIFVYMKQLEADYMPSPDYMASQREVDWQMRGVLVDWLIDIHGKFRLLPETLFLTLNIVDRFLSRRIISLAKLQLVGLTAMFVAAKYEEVLCPSIGNFIYIAEGGYTDEEILRAERYMLKILNFNLSYANPMNFLRRISKADNYDIQTRTVAKYFMEISLVDHRLLDHSPSLIAAASAWLARKCLERGEWNATLVHYSSYSQAELLGTAELMLDYCLRPCVHTAFFKKYSSKKFMRASTYVANWARTKYPAEAEEAQPLCGTDAAGDDDVCIIDLFADEGVERPAGGSQWGGAQSTRGNTASVASRANTPLLDCSRDFDQEVEVDEDD